MTTPTPRRSPRTRRAPAQAEAPAVVAAQPPVTAAPAAVAEPAAARKKPRKTRKAPVIKSTELSLKLSAADHALLLQLKQQLADAGVKVKKSVLLRTGLRLLAATDLQALQARLDEKKP